MLRVALDANVVVGALLRPAGPPGRIVAHLVERGGILAVVSPAILEEYRRSPTYPKVRKHLVLPIAEVGAWVDAFALLANLVAGERVEAVVVKDPEDDKYLSAALEGGASFVVSGDRHLLDLGLHGGVRVVSPREFLTIIEGRSRP